MHVKKLNMKGDQKQMIIAIALSFLTNVNNRNGKPHVFLCGKHVFDQYNDNEQLIVTKVGNDCKICFLLEEKRPER